MKLLSGVAVLTLLTMPVFAEGDTAKGENIFKRCKACHSIITPDGTALQKGGKTGPNLFGIIGRVVGSDPDFKYGDAMQAVAAKSLVWDEAAVAAYVTDPTAWLKEQSGDEKAVAKMTFKLPKGGDDIAAYLASNK